MVAVIYSLGRATAGLSKPYRGFAAMTNCAINFLVTTTMPGPYAAGGPPPLELSLMLGFTCCAVVLVVGVLALGIWVALRRRHPVDHGDRQ
jgi:hypothetical protein